MAILSKPVLNPNNTINHTLILHSSWISWKNWMESLLESEQFFHIIVISNYPTILEKFVFTHFLPKILDGKTFNKNRILLSRYNHFFSWWESYGDQLSGKIIIVIDEMIWSNDELKGEFWHNYKWQRTLAVWDLLISSCHIHLFAFSQLLPLVVAKNYLHLPCGGQLFDHRITSCFEFKNHSMNTMILFKKKWFLGFLNFIKRISQVKGVETLIIVISEDVFARKDMEHSLTFSSWTDFLWFIETHQDHASLKTKKIYLFCPDPLMDAKDNQFIISYLTQITTLSFYFYFLHPLEKLKWWTRYLQIIKIGWAYYKCKQKLKESF